MDLVVVGRHALFFDDDGAAAFVNSKEALVEWNSLSIDRYDVRHLLSNPPSSFRKLPHHHQQQQQQQQKESVIDLHLESEIDRERYADLPPPSPPPQQQDHEEPVAADNRAGAQYSAVSFSYGSTVDSSDQKIAEAEFRSTGFQPPFPLPDSLHQHLPPTEKVHQIIARTATFVSEHGGQSEIVLRVKQGDNPAFGFLMPHHHLHPYFRYLIDHQELLKIETDGNSKRGNADQATGVGAGGALSLLGSIYGSTEDEDAPAEGATETNQRTIVVTTSVAANLNLVEETNGAGRVSQKDETVSRVPHLSKDKASVQSMNRLNTSIKPGTGSVKKKEGVVLVSSSTAMDEGSASAVSSMSRIETPITEPPSDLKRSIDRIAEIILKNGQEFEKNLIEQDKEHGKFKFLLPSNQYHPYYLKVLKMNQEAKKIVKGGNSKKDGSSWQVVDEKYLASENETLAVHDLPLEYDRKDKFKMVIGKSKKDAVDQPKAVEEQFGVRVDVSAAAAILQAATRGIKHPNLEIFSKLSSNGANHLVGCEQAQGSSIGNFPSSQAEVSLQKKNETEHPKSSDVGMTKEQKLKAERLKRAKMFAAMIKSGAAAPGKEPIRGLSVEPPGSGISASHEDLVTEDAVQGEGRLLSTDRNLETLAKLEREDSRDESGELESKKRRHSRTRMHGDEEEGDNTKEDDDSERGHSRKKYKSHRSSDHQRDRSKDSHKHRKRHSSSRSKESHHRHKRDSPSEDDGTHYRRKHDSADEAEGKNHRHKNSQSTKDEKGHRKSSSRHGMSSGEDESSHLHKHQELSEDEARDHRGIRRKHENPRTDDNGRHRRSAMHKKGSHSEDPELEEGEISTKSPKQSPSTTGNGGVGSVSSINPVTRTQSLVPETTEVSDDLRAKIRAMLLATL